MKKITITIGIPTFNEEQNIEHLLEALMKQKLQNSTIKEILVYSDHSTDNTNAIVTRMSKKYKVITLLKGTSNKGKYFRVNELFNKCNTDVLVILDADLALVGDSFLNTLVTAQISDPKALMTAAHITLLRTPGFVAKVLHTSFAFWDFVRLSVPQYDSAGNFHGAATAYSGTFARHTKIPSNLLDPHLYIYLAAKKHDGFRYCREAEVLQYPPMTMVDMKKLLNRTIGKRDVKLEKIFTAEMIEKVHFIPKKYKVKGVFETFIHYPFYTPIALLLSFYIGRLKPHEKVNKSPIWEITTSTKKPIVYEK